MPAEEILDDIEAFVLDAFGTITDWHGTVTREIKDRAASISDAEAQEFTEEWRRGFMENTSRIAKGSEGPLSADVLHREILDSMLASARWSNLGKQWDENARQKLNLVWHHLDGWPDASKGLHGMKKKKLLVVLSNANIRLLADMAKHGDFPWDVVLSTELFGTYKPNEKVYKGAIHHLALPPSKIAMVAAHMWDLRGAASCGMRTIYVRRSSEDVNAAQGVKCKEEGGEVDIVVNDLVELAGMLERDTRVTQYHV
ncbi:haloacid dehalogenase [Athelia psychrophila]|uniref:Haloacid dehalogenase n=1 Tax=Athelia psychrophila TaxID=1759441 RepID=A0A166Q987_9AGAM|nr:haloacid dehalogenase [Fibularhizoctonia sp. CBS 109695]